MKKTRILILLSLLLLAGCTVSREEQPAVALKDSFTREPLLLQAAAPTVTPLRESLTPLHTLLASGSPPAETFEPDTVTPTPAPLPELPAEEPFVDNAWEGAGLEAAAEVNETVDADPSRKQSGATADQEQTLGMALCDLALSLEDSPYLKGGYTDAQQGFDSPGFVYFCLNKMGETTPLLTPVGYANRTQWSRVDSLEAAQPGDLLFFITGQEVEIDCVSIYLGDGQMIYPSASRKGVIVVSTQTAYWKRHFQLGRRVF